MSVTVLKNPVQIEAPLLVVRRKWDAGVKSFFNGLKRYVEAGGAP